MATGSSKIPRGLRIILLVVVMGAIIWLLVPAVYLYLAVACAVVILGLATFLTYRSPSPSGIEQIAPEIEKASDRNNVDLSQAEIDPPYSGHAVREEVNLGSSGSMLDFIKSSPNRPSPRSEDKIEEESIGSEPVNSEAPEPAQASEPAPEPEPDTKAPDNGGMPAMHLTNEESTLTEEDKRKLMNAVWYRCENPYCKYTQFLEVHYIIPEKDGGTNKLDNLIVLCPYCHALADKKEIPVEEMQEWVGREDRFKTKLDWKYFK
jgi:hypothetical protein